MTIPTLTPETCERLGMPRALDPHPVIPLPDVDGMAERGVSSEGVLDLLKMRHGLISRQHADPLRHGWESAGFARVRQVLAEMREAVPKGVLFVLMLGGNRAGKSDVCAKLVMEILTGKPQRRAWCFQGTQTISREVQQPYMWKYFPPEWKPQGEARGLKRTAVTKVVYTQGTGFSADSFVLPNGSQADFKFYAADITTLQGPEQDVIWFDELVPASWVEDSKYRLVTRNGIMLVSFTPIDGYTETVSLFLDGAVATESMPAELLPLRAADGTVIGYEEVPLIMRCSDPSKVVIYFPTEENFYGGYETMKRTLQGRSREEILVRAYGVPLRKYGAVFQFRAANVLGPEGLAAVLAAAGDYTWYHLMDPAGTGAARNPFMQWWAVSKMGQKICVREWPQPGDYIPGVGAEKGVWAESGGSADGKRGPGQEWFGLGLEDLAMEIERVERELAATCPSMDRVPVRERWMDSRAGNSTTMTSDGAVTLIELFEELPKERRLYFDPAPGRQTNETGESWKMIVQAMLEPNKLTGTPQLMVAQSCANTVFALLNWTGLDKEKGACKDPVDCVKYFTLTDAQWMEPKEKRQGTATAWGGYGQRSE